MKTATAARITNASPAERAAFARQIISDIDEQKRLIECEKRGLLTSPAVYEALANSFGLQHLTDLEKNFDENTLHSDLCRCPDRGLVRAQLFKGELVRAEIGDSPLPAITFRRLRAEEVSAATVALQDVMQMKRARSGVVAAEREIERAEAQIAEMVAKIAALENGIREWNALIAGPLADRLTVRRTEQEEVSRDWPPAKRLAAQKALSERDEREAAAASARAKALGH